MITCVVIVAAGKGTRMNMDINKQYIEIAGIPILARTLMTFEDFKMIDGIVLVVNSEDIMWCRENIIDRYSISKARVIVAGGETRQISVCNGLEEVPKETDIVLIHDGARPFINTKSIMDSITAANEFGASCVAVPVKDTIKKVNDQNFVLDTPDRRDLWAVQTPQTFKYDIIKKAHKKAIEDGFDGTDDAVLVERLGIQLKLVKGTYDNIKITTSEDLVFAEALAINTNLLQKSQK